MNIIIALLFGDAQDYLKMVKVYFIGKLFFFFKENVVTICYFLGAYTTHQMVVRMALTSYDQIPDKLAEFCYVEYTMPQTVVSHCTIRSVSVQDSDSDDPPEKYVRYLSRYEYQ